MSIRRPSFRLDIDARFTTMECLYGYLQIYKYFDFSSLEAVCFNAYVRKLFCYENLQDWYNFSIGRLKNDAKEHELAKQKLQECKDEILVFERDSNLIPLLKISLSRLKMVASHLDFEEVIALSHDEWRTGIDKGKGFSKVSAVFRKALVKDDEDDILDWFGRRSLASRNYEIEAFVNENPNATFDQIKNCIERKINFNKKKEQIYRLNDLEEKLSQFQKSIAEQENKLENEFEKAKQKDRHINITILISIFSAVMWQSMNHMWWLGLITYPIIGYLCFVGSLLKEKKNLTWKKCLSLHKQFCDAVKNYITQHKTW